MSDMFSKTTFVEIKKDELLGKVQELAANDYTLSMITVGQRVYFKLMYFFEKDYEMVGLRFRIKTNEEEVDSICKLYPNSYLYENEIKELFGIKIRNMDRDFQGNLYKKAQGSPFVTPPKDKEGE